MQVISLLAALLYIVFETKRDFPEKYTHDKELTLNIFHFGKYTLGTNLFSGISRSLDHFVTAGVLAPKKEKITLHITILYVGSIIWLMYHLWPQQMFFTLKM